MPLLETYHAGKEFTELDRRLLYSLSFAGRNYYLEKNIPVSINYYLKERYKVKLLLLECVTCKWYYCTIIYKWKDQRLYQLRKIRSQILVDFLTIKSVWLSTVLRSTQAVYNLIYCVLIVKKIFTKIFTPRFSDWRSTVYNIIIFNNAIRTTVLY